MKQNRSYLTDYDRVPSVIAAELLHLEFFLHKQTFVDMPGSVWAGFALRAAARPHCVKHSGSHVPAAPNYCHPDQRSSRSWHSLRDPDRARMRILRPMLQLGFYAGLH